MSLQQEKQNIYEGMYVISSTLSEDARQKALDRITSGITEMGGTVHKIHDQGRRRLAYEVEGHREGHYFLIYRAMERVPPQRRPSALHHTTCRRSARDHRV